MCTSWFVAAFNNSGLTGQRYFVTTNCVSGWSHCVAQGIKNILKVYQKVLNIHMYIYMYILKDIQFTKYRYTRYTR